MNWNEFDADTFYFPTGDMGLAWIPSFPDWDVALKPIELEAFDGSEQLESQLTTSQKEVSEKGSVDEKRTLEPDSPRFVNTNNAPDNSCECKLEGYKKRRKDKLDNFTLKWTIFRSFSKYYRQQYMKINVYW